MTPLQMATMTAVVANGGYRGAAPGAGRRCREPEHVALDPDALGWCATGMWAVVNEPGGTAYGRRGCPAPRSRARPARCRSSPRRQRTEAEALPFNYRDHAWFTSFAPLDNPQIVVIDLRRARRLGLARAAPIAQALYAKFFKVDLAILAAR